MSDKSAQATLQILATAEALALRLERLEGQLRRFSAASDIRVATVKFVGDWATRAASSMPVERRQNYTGAPPPKTVLLPYPGHCNVSLYGKSRAVAGFSVVGLSRNELESFVDTIAARQRKEKSFLAVFLTDCADFSVFRKHGFIFEYIPPSGDPKAQHTWKENVADRTRSFKKKWGVSKMLIASGSSQLGDIASSVSLSRFLS